MNKYIFIAIIVAFALSISYAGDVLKIPAGGAGVGATATDVASQASILQLRNLNVQPDAGWQARRVSDWSFLNVAGQKFTNSEINATNNTWETLTVPAHGLTTGDGPYTYHYISGGLVSGLSSKIDYYVRVLNADTIQLYMDYETAIRGVANPADPTGEIATGENAIYGVTSDRCTHDQNVECKAHETCVLDSFGADINGPTHCYMAPHRIFWNGTPFVDIGDVGDFVPVSITEGTTRPPILGRNKTTSGVVLWEISSGAQRGQYLCAQQGMRCLLTYNAVGGVLIADGCTDNIGASTVYYALCR